MNTTLFMEWITSKVASPTWQMIITTNTLHYISWNGMFLIWVLYLSNMFQWRIYSTPPFLHLISSLSCLTLFQTGVLELQFSYAIHTPAEEEERILSPFILITKQHYSTLLMLGILLALSSVTSTCTVTYESEIQGVKSGEIPLSRNNFL